jgi:SnoaL-like domain
MNSHPISSWHNIVGTRDARGLADLLADEVVFYSPVVHTPQIGKAITTLYLTAAVTVFGNDSFRYVREVISERDAVLEFETEIDGILVNGVDMIKWNDDGKITEFKVMIRPLKAINLIHQKMGEMLQRAASTQTQVEKDGIS